jgi:hypothetical protein
LRCTYVSDGGCRCSARAFLQLHHERPWARGGASDAENLRLLCAVHNRLFGRARFRRCPYCRATCSAARRPGERLILKRSPPLLLGQGEPTGVMCRRRQRWQARATARRRDA